MLEIIELLLDKMLFIVLPWSEVSC